jgi:antitoxin Phd
MPSTTLGVTRGHRAATVKPGGGKTTLMKAKALRPFIHAAIKAKKAPVSAGGTQVRFFTAGGLASLEDMSEVSASVLKNKFSKVARLASTGPLAISRHSRREFVILTAEQYEELQQSRRAPLETLAGEFDQLVARMKTPKAKHAADALFSASGKALGKAAVSAHRAAHA